MGDIKIKPCDCYLTHFYILERGRRDVLFKMSFPLMTTFIIENKTKIKEGLLQPMTNVELWFSTLVSIFLGSFYEIS